MLVEKVDGRSCVVFAISPGIDRKIQAIRIRLLSRNLDKRRSNFLGLDGGVLHC